MIRTGTAIAIATLFALLQVNPAAAQSTHQRAPQNVTGSGSRAVELASGLSAPAPQPSTAQTAAKTPTPASSGNTNDPVTPPGGLRSKLGTALHRFESAHFRDPRLRRASVAFPAFCRNWERKLKERTANNLRHIVWKLEHGYETGTYVGYGSIRSCSCKAGTRGVPIGELTYQEFNYQLTGPTIEQARHSKPKPVGITNTTEIFRWGGHNWVY